MSKLFKERVTRDKYGFTIANNGLEKYYETDESFKNSSGASRVIANGGKYAPSNKRTQQTRVSASDYFKAPNEVRAKAQYREDYNNRSIYSRRGINASNTHKNTVNDFSRLVADDDILSATLVDSYTKETYTFNREFNNRVQYFYFGKDQKMIDYKEITKVEQISSEGYYDLKQVGYNNFYELHKKNDFGIEQVLCVLALKK